MAQLAEHVMVCGPSGGGKSTYLREKHAEYGGSSIFLTTKSGDEDTAPDHDPPRRLCRFEASYPDDIVTARQWSLERGGDVQVIVDEAHNAPSFQEGEGPIDTGMREDRSAGVTYVVATQNPQNLNNDKDGYGLVQQCEYWVFVGPAKDWHVGFFNANNMSELVDYMPTSNFEYVVVSPIAALSPAEKIVYRGETSKAYA